MARRQPPLTVNFDPPYTSEELSTTFIQAVRVLSMKSAHRHELQTNALAQRLEVAVERFRPYVTMIAGVILFVTLAMLIYSFMSKASATRQGDAWNAFNEAIGAAPPNLDDLHSSAQEYPGTKMQELADIAWADGQVFLGAQNYIHNRRAANQALRGAANTYNALLKTSSDEHLLNRAHLGLARVFEMQNQLEKARDQYRKLDGGFKEYGKQQAERLAQPAAVETYAWLEKAQPPRATAPAGPGTPGQRPEFSAGDLSMPDATPGLMTEPTGEAGPSFEELLKGLDRLPTQTGEPPQDGTTAPPTSTELPGTATPAPETDAAAPATDGAAPAAETGKAEGGADSESKPPAESVPPAAEAGSTEEKSAE
jgi:hypothetical protein